MELAARKPNTGANSAHTQDRRSRKPNLCTAHFQANEKGPAAITMHASRTLGLDRYLAPLCFKVRARVCPQVRMYENDPLAQPP